MKYMRNKKGFTLIELIVVIAILGILAAVLIPQFGGFQDRARKTQALVDAKQIATAIDSLRAESATNAFTTDKAAILLVAGIPAADVANLTLYTEGGFLWTISTVTLSDNTNPKAGRTSSQTKVIADPPAGEAIT